MDLYPVKAQFLTSEEVRLKLETDGFAFDAAQVRIWFLNRLVFQKTLRDISDNTDISLGEFDTDFGGYGVSVTLLMGGESVTLCTAFDVVDDARRSLRYGFVSDFTQSDEDNGAMEWLCKCHINLVQYYDWSYRHDKLVTEQPLYKDMMGKDICRRTVIQKIRQGHSMGMRAMAYGAVYAASKVFFEAHRNWALYNSCQQPFVFIDVFYIMNVQEGSPWREHLIGQYRSAMDQMGFDGIHMDTYGFPKTAYSHLRSQPELIRLERAFPSLIAQTRETLSAGGTAPYLIFNQVGNWPSYTTAAAPQDAVYIEVWSPYERYWQLAQLIEEARLLADSCKPIILAAYLKPFRDAEGPAALAAALLLTAIIVSYGAYHLLTGECKAVLTQGYYSDYTRLSDMQANALRRYYDFMIRYLNLFYDPDLRNVSMTHMGWDNYEYACLSHPVSSYGEAGKLWAILREKPTRKCLFLINLCQCTDDYWNEGKPEPTAQRGVHWRVQTDYPITGIYTASPEYPHAQPLPFGFVDSEKGRFVDFVVPVVKIWSIVWIE